MEPTLCYMHYHICAMLKSRPHDLTGRTLYLQSLRMPEGTLWASAQEHMPQLGALMLPLMVTLL